MQVKRLKDVPVHKTSVVCFYVPFLVILGAIYAFPENPQLTPIMRMTIAISLMMSAVDAAAAVYPKFSHEANIAENGVRMSGALDLWLALAVSGLAASVMSWRDASEVAALLLFGYYVRFSSWWFWDRSQADKEEADIVDGPFSEIPARCDCRCEMAMSQDEINELAMSSGLRDRRSDLRESESELLATVPLPTNPTDFRLTLRDGLLHVSPYAGDPRGDGDVEDDPTPPRSPAEFAKAVTAMHLQTQHVGSKIDVEV